jgi:hypothetical protein
MNFRNLAVLGLLFAASVTRALATVAVPEVEGVSGSGALVLIGGAALIIRSRRNRK